MKKLLLIVLALLVVASPVFAQTVNNNGGTRTLSPGDVTQAGAASSSSATGGSVGPITNTNTNVNANSNTNHNNSSARSSSDATAVSTQQQKQGNDQSISSTSNTDVPNPAPPIFIPNLVAAPETCMGSMSAGASGSNGMFALGIGFGTTWKSHDCELRMFARSILSLGPSYVPAAVALLSQNSDVKQAMQDAGIQIPGQAAPAPARTSMAVPVPSSSSAATQGGVIEKKDVSSNEQIAMRNGWTLGPACGDGKPSIIRKGDSLYSCSGWDREGLSR